MWRILILILLVFYSLDYEIHDVVIVYDYPDEKLSPPVADFDSPLIRVYLHPEESKFQQYNQIVENLDLALDFD